MPIILQVTAWTILAVGLLALGHKFFPNLKQWFSTGKVSYVWLFAITLGLFLLLTYPYFFNWWAVNFWNVPKSELSDFTKLGPLGDIYGSLNTLISSIALCAVAFSTWLQIISLRVTRIANERQLKLAEVAHKEQMKASEDAIFSNMFYNLLIHNKNTVNALTITNNDGCLTKQDILELTSNELSRLLREDWKDNLDSVDRVDAARALRNFISKISDGKTSTGFYSAFYNYKTLIMLVKSHKNQALRESYFQIIANSMSYTEKKLLLWLSINGRNTEYLDCFKETKILDLKLEPVVYSEKESKRAEERDLMLRFVKHFQIDPSSFKYHPDSANLKEETPA